VKQHLILEMLNSQKRNADKQKRIEKKRARKKTWEQQQQISSERKYAIAAVYNT
jgi:hypothetical protein